MKASIQRSVSESGEFESCSEELYIRITKPIRTPGGDLIKIIFIEGGNALVKNAVKNGSELGGLFVSGVGGDVIFSIKDAIDFIVGVWDKVTKVVDGVLGGNGGGGSQECNPTVNVNVSGTVGGNLTISGITINNTCKQ